MSSARRSARRPPRLLRTEGATVTGANTGAVWTQESSGRVRTPFEPLVLGSALALIPVLIIEADVKSGAWVTAADVANWLIWAVFGAQLVFVLVVAPRKLAALRAHWLDAAIVVLTVPVFGAFLSGLRLLRLARLLRLLRASAIVGRAIQAERTLTSGVAFRLAALLTVFIVVVAGSAQATFDAHDFHSVWDGVWWSVVTVTTVGYGDLYPKTVQGRLIGIVVMLVGIGFLSVLTATVAAHFVKTDTGSTDVRDALQRIEKELVEIKARLASS
jgi:voltage-gated potassium channel